MENMNDDLISRQAAIDEIDEWIKAFRENGHKESAADACLIQDGIIQLPSAQPKTQLSTEDTTFDTTFDCISRQAAIDVTWKEPIYTDPYNVLTEVRDGIKALPSAQQWIPCSERLPEVHESGNSFSGIYMQSVPALVYGICEGEGNAQFHVATYCDDLDGNTYWSTELDALTITEVKAWMPLPEPWKGEQP